MSQIFNIVEELEKERKKNKELEERNEVLEKGCKEYRYHLKQMNKIHDNCLDTIEELQERISKVIEYIEHLDNVFIDSKEQDNIVNILKGDNK